MGADNKDTTTTCKETDKNLEPDGTPPTIVMGVEADATYSKDSGTKDKDKADVLDGTPPANEIGTDNININKASAATAKEGLCRADNPQDAIVAGPKISKSSAAASMDALLDTMSPECKALIIMPTESPIAKVCKPLNPAFRKGMQKIRDRRFRTLEAAYSGYNPLDYFEADIDTVELPPLKQNVVTLVFLYVLDGYGYVLDADLKVFDDEASNSASEINKEQTLEADPKRSYYGDLGTTVTPQSLFPMPRRIDRDFNKTIWGSPDLPAAVRPPEEIKSRLPVLSTSKLKSADKPDKDETMPVAPPRALTTLTSKSRIPIFPATPRSKVVSKVGLSKKVFSQVCGRDPSIPLPPIRLVWGSARGNLRTVPANAFKSADGAFVPAPGVLTGFPAGSVLASASTQAPGSSNAIIVRRKPDPTAHATPERISVAVSNRRSSTSRFSTPAVLVKKAPAPVAPKNLIGSGISTELSSWKQRLAKEPKDVREGHVEKRGVTFKKVVVEKKAIKKRPSNARMPARSKEPTISDELSDPQSPNPADNNAANNPPSFVAPNLENSFASTSARREDNAVSKESIRTPTSANREDNAVPEVKESAHNADIANLRYNDEESSAGSKSPHEPKPVKKRKPQRRRRPRKHGAVSQNYDDAGDTSTAEVSRQDNAASVDSSLLKAISAPEEASPAEKKIEEPVPPTSANKNRESHPPSPNLPPAPAPTLSSSLDLAELPQASVTQLMCLDAMPSEPARAFNHSIHQRDLDLKGLRQEMDEELDKKLSAQNAAFEAMLKATIQSTVNGLTGEFDRKLDLQTKSLEDKIREKDAKISLQEAEIEALKAQLRLLEETKSSANQGSSAADDENQVGDNTEAAETEYDEFFDAEEGMPEPAPLSSNVATTNQAQEPEVIHLPGSNPAIWHRVQPKLRWLLVGTFVVLVIIAALRAFAHSGRNEELPIPALPSFNTKEARLYLERLIRQGIGRREIANIAPYLYDLEEILTSIPTRTYNMPTQTYDLGLMDSF